MAFCGKCGSQLHDNATFCANCGASTGTSIQTAAAAPPSGTPLVVPTHLEESKGFFGSLFDLSFTSFVTSKIIKFLYVLFMIVFAIVVIVMVVLAQNQQNPVPIVAIIAAPIVYFIYLILMRVQLEILIVLFRMSEHLAEIAKQGRER